MSYKTPMQRDYVTLDEDGQQTHFKTHFFLWASATTPQLLSWAITAPKFQRQMATIPALQCPSSIFPTSNSKHSQTFRNVCSSQQPLNILLAVIKPQGTAA